MPSLPTPLRSGDPITAIAPWSAKIIDYLRAITPRPSATVEVNTHSNGTTFRAMASGGKAAMGGGGSPYVYSGEFAIEPTPSENINEDVAFRVNGGTVMVNGVRKSMGDKYAVLTGEGYSSSIYLLLLEVEDCGEKSWQLDVGDDPSDALAYVELGTVTKTPAQTEDESGNVVEVEKYTVVQKYLGGTGLCMVVAEGCEDETQGLPPSGSDSGASGGGGGENA